MTATGRAAEILRGEGMSERTRVRLRALTQWLHLSAMAGLVGSAVLLRVAFVPYVEDPDRRVPAEVAPGVLDRWYSVFPWVGAAVFIGTGVFLFLFWLRDAGLTLRQPWATTYVQLLLVKIVLANAALVIGIGLGLSRSMAEDAEGVAGGDHRLGRGDRAHLRPTAAPATAGAFPPHRPAGRDDPLGRSSFTWPTPSTDTVRPAGVVPED